MFPTLSSRLSKNAKVLLRLEELRQKKDNGTNGISKKMIKMQSLKKEQLIPFETQVPLYASLDK